MYDVSFSSQPSDALIKLCDETLADLKKKIASNGETIIFDAPTSRSIIEG